MKRIIITAILTFTFTTFAIQAVEQTAFKGAGIIESTIGGFKFPDGSVQVSAASLPPILPPAWIDDDGEILGNQVHIYGIAHIGLVGPGLYQQIMLGVDESKITQRPPLAHSEAFSDWGIIYYEVAGCAGPEMWSYPGATAMIDAVLYQSDPSTNSAIEVLSTLECNYGACSCQELGEPGVPYDPAEMLVEYKNFNQHPLPYTVSINYLP